MLTPNGGVFGRNPTFNNVTVETNLTVNGDFIVGTSGKGIDFSATANGSGTMTSELLSDYEEGTWTPTFSPASGAFTTLTMAVVSATYTKIGRQVTVRAYFNTSAVTVGTATGNLLISGLPFAGASNGAGVISLARNWTTAPRFVYSGGSALVLTGLASLGGDVSFTQVSDLTPGALAGKNETVVVCTYFT